MYLILVKDIFIWLAPRIFNDVDPSPDSQITLQLVSVSFESKLRSKRSQGKKVNGMEIKNSTNLGIINSISNEIFMEHSVKHSSKTFSETFRESKIYCELKQFRKF